jgi:hypothetical protein
LGAFFRDANGVCTAYFAQYLDHGDALLAELNVAMIAIEKAASKQYTNL